MIAPLKIIFAGVCAGWMLAGCGESEPAAPTHSAPPPAAMPILEAAVPAEPVPESMPALDVAGGAGNPAGTIAPAREFLLAMEDAEGNRLTDSLAVVQRAVQLYEEARYGGSDTDNAQPLAEITDLSQLIQHGFLKSLPPSPPGQKFVLDPQTKRVKLAAQ
jgi:hypothetical protein